MGEYKLKHPEDLPSYQVADYHQWEGQWELIKGIPYAMTPAPLPNHQRLARRLMRLLEDALAQCASCEVMPPVNLKLGESTVLQPDLSVFCGEAPESLYITTVPELVVEILSPSTEHKDRNLKRGLYQEHGVRYYLLVDPHPGEVEVLQLVDRHYETAWSGTSGPFPFDLPGCQVTLDFGQLSR